MASVVDITPPHPAPGLSFHQISVASRRLAWLFTALFVIFIMIALFSLWLLLFYRGQIITLGSITNAGHPPLDFVPFNELQPGQKLASVCYGIARGVPSISLFWCLRLLCRAYARGEVFTARTAKLIRFVSICVVLDATMPAFRRLVLGTTAAEIDRIWAQMAMTEELMFAFVIGMIAYVTQAGQEIEQDREGFV